VRQKLRDGENILKIYLFDSIQNARTWRTPDGRMDRGTDS